MRRAASHLLPASLEQRGAAVPFTTPALAMARVRPDQRHDLVLALRGFSGDGAYIVPWKSVPDLAPMTIHDRALHEEIAVAGAVTPLSVRRCALKVASTGLAGPGASEAAKRAVENDDHKALETHFLLIVALLSAAQVSVNDLIREGTRTGEWRDTARQLLEQAANRVGVQAGGFLERSEALSRTLAPIGLANAPSGSRIRDLLDMLGAFKESVGTWSIMEQSELGEAAKFASEVAETTIIRVQHVLGQFDSRTKDPGWMLRDWRLEVTVCTAIANRLTWLLDGWDYVIGLWDAAPHSEIEQQREIMDQLIPLLPVIPSSEAQTRAAGKKVRPLWSNSLRESGPAEIELIARLEAAKARAAAL